MGGGVKTRYDCAMRLRAALFALVLHGDPSRPRRTQSSASAAVTRCLQADQLDIDGVGG